MYLPPRVTFSKRVTDQFRTIKTNTGVNNNVLARFAISLALECGENIENVSPSDSSGQTLDRDLLFGELLEIYEAMIREYITANRIEMPLGTAIALLVETGAHRMGHVRSLSALASLGRRRANPA